MDGYILLLKNLKRLALGIIPFLIIGAITNWVMDISFGGSSWAIALGLMTCAICGLFALANKDQENYKDEE